ncbi:MAG TPA: methyltransferase [Sphingomonas sp.]|nr:methyltransferase [Sphingomonas sp.]
MKRVARSAIVLLLAGSASALAAPPPRLPANIARAAADPARHAQAADDARRHGPEILAFAGVKPGDKVIDLIPGSAYWTRLFAKAVGPKGHVYGIWPAPYAAEAKKDVQAYKALAGSKDYLNVSMAIEPAAVLNAPEKVDIVFTSQNYHDYPDRFMGHIDPSVLNKAVFAALKPGGTYIVIDHAAPAGSGMSDTDTLHRIDPAIVKKQVTAAGFRFVGASDLLRNPADDHSKKVFDKSIRGHTDQFIFKFRKPG